MILASVPRAVTLNTLARRSTVTSLKQSKVLIRKMSSKPHTQEPEILEAKEEFKGKFIKLESLKWKDQEGREVGTFGLLCILGLILMR